MFRDAFISSKSELRPEAGELQSEMKNSIVVLQGKSETASVFVRDTHASIAIQSCKRKLYMCWAPRV